MQLYMTDVKNSKTVVMPAIVLATSLYSVWFMWAIILGYFSSKIFYIFFVESGKVDCIFIKWRKWKIHFHHWIMGAMVLGIAWILDYYLSTFLTGFVIGVIIHDIYDFNDWYKVVLRDPLQQAS